MRRLLLATAVTVTAAAVMAQVKLVGHRGSAYGVESTAEAFRNAARMGADYVETDIKVTADGHFVLSHDDTLRRMGSMRVIPESTLAELQADTLRQTRNGVEYTGRLMELGEWLDLCHELGVRPLIEFKYGTGVNNNDQSNIPALIEIVRQKGFEHDCIILTSMKKCLEFVRANYPEIAIQFLTAQYEPNHYEWCVEQGFGADVAHPYVDSAVIERYHSHGLPVNAWTVDDPAIAARLKAAGIDFITTNVITRPQLDSL